MTFAAPDFPKIPSGAGSDDWDPKVRVMLAHLLGALRLGYKQPTMVSFIA